MENDMRFRTLRAEEIECRVGTVGKSGNGLSLLLYKTSRTDADILDETVGSENWQCEFYECKGTLFCKVGILVDRGDGLAEWVWKDDAGSPSNMEAEKGEASDAFKRACFKWGLGRELYTAPRIWIYGDRCNIKQVGDGRFQCYDSFSVENIEVAENRIQYLAIRNDTKGEIVFAWAAEEVQPAPMDADLANAPSTEQLNEISELVENLASVRGVDNSVVIKYLMESNALRGAGVQNNEIKTFRQAQAAIGQLRSWTKGE